MSDEILNYAKYDPVLQEKYDLSAKQVAVNFLESTGLFTLETSLEKQPEMYKDYDFYIRYKDGLNRTVEVEQKAVWTREKEWQYAPSGIHIPERKRKSKADIFIMINKSGKTLLFVPIERILESPVIKKDTFNNFTGRRTQNEEFFELSLSTPELVFYYLEGNIWKAVNP
jgi:hypothetical protein